MPAITTYQQLLNETDSEKVYLAEIEPAMKISGWTLAPGKTYAYSAPIESGMVVTRLKEEETNLVERQSLADVEANAGSWYFDPAAGILYARSSDVATPSGHFMTAYFLEVFATHPRIFNNRFYRPMIASLPEFRQAISERKTGETLQTSGQLSMLEDSDRPYWRTKTYSYNWINKRVTVKLGGADKDYPYSEFKTVARWIMKGNRLTDKGVNFEVADLKNLFRTRIGVDKYSLTAYPNMEPGAEGKTIQLAFGEIKNARAVLIDSTAGAGGKWKLSAGPIQAITAVYDNGAPAAFTADTAIGGFTLNAAATGKITADFKGLKDGATYLQKGGQIAKYILRNYLSITDADLIPGDYDSLDAARPYTLGLYVERETRVEDLLSTIENSNHCFFYTDRETGKIGVKTFIPPDASDPARIILKDENIFDWEVETDEEVYYEINVSYGKDFDSGDSKYAQAIDAGSGYLNDLQEGKTVETAILGKADAQTLANLLLPYFSAPRLLAGTETHIRPLDRNLYDNVEVDRSGRPAYPDSIYAYRLIGLREKATKNKKRVNLTLTRNLQTGQ